MQINAIWIELKVRSYGPCVHHILGFVYMFHSNCYTFIIHISYVSSACIFEFNVQDSQTKNTKWGKKIYNKIIVCIKHKMFKINASNAVCATDTCCFLCQITIESPVSCIKFPEREWKKQIKWNFRYVQFAYLEKE